MLTNWVKGIFSSQEIQLRPLQGDAGFRCYYRFLIGEKTYIAVDAPPKYSNNLAFVEIANALTKQSILVPEIIAADLEQGFMCISDLGECLLADALNEQSMSAYYQQAIEHLVKFSKIKQCGDYQLPCYDNKFSLLELNIFTEWLLNKHLAITLTSAQTQQLENCFKTLVDNSEEQPKVFMHRDYHSRNLMLTKHEQIAVIDFQDAVYGPITYDVVSLLRDCYVKWPQHLIDPLFEFFVEKIAQQHSLNFPLIQWQRWFDLQGLQRHIKASGIFARLHHRDQKSGYLADIPLTLSYVVEISEKYPELAFLAELTKQEVIPALTLFNKKVGRL